MNPLSAESSITWADRLARLPWPLTLDAFRRTAIGFGWSPTDRPWKFVVDFTNGLWRMMLFRDRSGGIHSISFPLIKPPGESAEDAAQLSELFVSYETTEAQVWDKPFYTSPSEDSTIT